MLAKPGFFAELQQLRFCRLGFTTGVTGIGLMPCLGKAQLNAGNASHHLSPKQPASLSEAADSDSLQLTESACALMAAQQGM